IAWRVRKGRIFASKESALAVKRRKSMGASFWSTIAESRLTRRRALVGGAAATTGALLLAACGGGSSKSSGGDKQQTSGLVTQPVDMTKQARRGGSMKYSISADIPNFDAHILSRTDAEQVLLNYNRLTRVKPGILEPSDG